MIELIRNIAIIAHVDHGKTTLVDKLLQQSGTLETRGKEIKRVMDSNDQEKERGITILAKNTAVSWHDYRINIVDTPGHADFGGEVERVLSMVDSVLLLVDAQRGINADTQVILDGLKKQNRQVMLGINKVDLVKKPVLLDLAATLSATGLFTEIFMISAETGDGVEDLMNYLSASAGESPWMYPEDQISDMPSRLLAAEITREKVFLQLHQELPYAVTVETEKWEQRDDGSARVDQVIFVERPGQKAIVLGKKGSRIKKIGEASRKELENLLGHRVHLFLFVKVREKWGDDPERYHEWGLDFNAK